MNNLKNSIFSKVLQVLLIGYFLINSLSLSHNLSRIATKNTDVHKIEHVVWSIFKKFIKYSCSAEELEDSDNESGVSSNKMKLTADYLLPNLAGIVLCHECPNLTKKVYATQSDFSGILHNKIHVPPPDSASL